MHAALDIPAGLARSAGRVWFHAEEALREPEGEPLLADANGTGEEDAGGEGGAPDLVVEASPERGVADERGQGHGPKI
jgi:hypothetical protein